MRIAICHFRYGMLDGVSLEMEKWARALERLGHEVLIVAGEDPTGKAQVLPELALFWAEGIRRNAFDTLSLGTSADLKEEVEHATDRVAEVFATFLPRERVDLLIVENIWSLPANIPAALGILRAVESLGLPVIAHHHDFWWERDIYRPAFPEVRELLGEIFPPDYGRAEHVVINSLAQRELRRRRGLEARVVPNVFDFEVHWEKDSFNASLREDIGIRPGDIVFLQATRVVARKGIEIALELVKRFQDEVLPDIDIPGKGKHAVILLPNLIEDSVYYRKLLRRAEELGVEAIFCPDRFAAERSLADGVKIYSFWDAYTASDFVTYPSLYEGFGNQFLEAIAAKLPLAVFEYPVFEADIKPLGFRYVSLGNEFRRDEDGLARVPEEVISHAAREVGELLTDDAAREEMVEHNHALGREHFSLERLKRDLEETIGGLI
ncbi:glycosyltransferase [Candidatus Bipolaricaulota sp. J31]